MKNIAVDTDGTVAASWDYGAGSAVRAGIDLLETGHLAGSIDTGAYIPAHIAYGEDHNLWTFGWQARLGNGSSTDQQDYMTIRRFSRDGKQTGAWLPRSSFPKGLDPAGGSWQVTRITVVKDRIGVLATSGGAGSQQEWIELDLQGNLLGRWRLDDSNFARVALTTDGRVYAQQGNGPSNARFFALNRSALAWRPVTPPTSDWFYGADGDKLVFTGWNWKPGPLHLRWFDQPSDH